MGRSPCCEKVGLKKGSWTPEEDQKLMSYIQEHGHGSWRALPAKAGLQRCGKSCRLRWTNYLRPDIKRGKFSLQEEQTIIQLHALLGNRWSAIATHLPKRTDNEIKNYWNTHLKKRLTKMGIDPVTHKPKSYALGSATAGGQSKDANNLSHMAQWESARLEAEARFVREYKHSFHPFQHHQYKQRLPVTALPINRSLAPPNTIDVVNSWQGLLSSVSTAFGDISPFNPQESVLPAVLPSCILGQEVSENSVEKAENDWNRCIHGLDKGPDFIKDNATPPFPESTWIANSMGNNNAVTSCASFHVDGFSHHLLPDNSSLSFGEDSDNADGNCPAGSGGGGGGGGGGFEETNQYWNNIISLLDSSSYSLENV